MEAGLDLEATLFDNLFAPEGSPADVASPKLAMRRAGHTSVRYELCVGEGVIARFSRLPVAGEGFAVEVEPGMDCVLVSAVAIVAAYAIRDLYVAVYSKAAQGEQRVDAYMDQLLAEAQAVKKK